MENLFLYGRCVIFKDGREEGSAKCIAGNSRNLSIVLSLCAYSEGVAGPHGCTSCARRPASQGGEAGLRRHIISSPMMQHLS